MSVCCAISNDVRSSKISLMKSCNFVWVLGVVRLLLLLLLEEREDVAVPAELEEARITAGFSLWFKIAMRSCVEQMILSPMNAVNMMLMSELLKSGL